MIERRGDDLNFMKIPVSFIQEKPNDETTERKVLN